MEYMMAKQASNAKIISIKIKRTIIDYIAGQTDKYFLNERKSYLCQKEH